MTNPNPSSYEDADGVRHEIVVRQTRSGRWQVLDTTSESRELIETLTGVGEGRDQAEAIARDYASQRALVLTAHRG
jgi:hypothetical protein